MSERYTRIYTLENNLYTEGAPVLIRAGALLRDNVTGSILGQVKFENLSSKIIIALKVRIAVFDMADRRLGEDLEHQYLYLSARPNEEFGSKNAVPLPDNAAGSFLVDVVEVIFEDKSIWTETTKFEPVRKQDMLKDVLKDSELVKQYQIKTNSESRFLPVGYKDLYLCSCGRAYKNSMDVCPFCQKSFNFLEEALDVDALKQEQSEREKRKEKRGKRQKKQSAG